MILLKNICLMSGSTKGSLSVSFKCIISIQYVCSMIRESKIELKKRTKRALIHLQINSIFPIDTEVRTSPNIRHCLI